MPYRTHERRLDPSALMIPSSYSLKSNAAPARALAARGLRSARRIALAGAAALWAGTALPGARGQHAIQAQNPLPAVPWQPGPERYSVTVAGSPDGPTLSLYPQNGVVGVSTGYSLYKDISNPSAGAGIWNFVELYDHMCPHCWYAVPIVTDLARAYQGVGWGMHTLNCHMRHNAEVCFFLEVITQAKDYPTFVLCPPRSDHQLNDAAYLRGLSARARGLVEHLKGEQRSTFLELARCTHRYVEKDASDSGPFLSALDVADWIQEKTGFPAAHPKLLNQGADFTEPTYPRVRAAPGRPGWLRDDKPGAPGVPAFVPGQRWFDAIRGFAFLIFHNYREERHQVTIDSARFLSRSFPIKGKELAALANTLQHTGSQTPMEFRKILKTWADGAGIPFVESSLDHGERIEEEKYMTCDSGPCAMWTLLHVTLTAVAARGLSGRALLGEESLASARDDESGAGLVSKEEAMHFVRNMVDAFMSCRQCKKQFIRDFDNCEYGRCSFTDWRGLPLWLWRVHNAISLRVAIEQQAEVDRRWPMYEDCPTCWKEDLVMNGLRSSRRLLDVPYDGRRMNSMTRREALHAEDLNAAFNLDHVFWHMVRTFVGVQRVAFELSDLSPAEQSQVKAVLQRERAVAAGGDPGAGAQHDAHRGHPQAEGNRAVNVVEPLGDVQLTATSGPVMRKLVLGVIMLASAATAVLCYMGYDIRYVMRELIAYPGEAARAPMMRAPQESAACQDDEDDAVEGDGDLAEPGGTVATRANDPAAE